MMQQIEHRLGEFTSYRVLGTALNSIRVNNRRASFRSFLLRVVEEWVPDITSAPPSASASDVGSACENECVPHPVPKRFRRAAWNQPDLVRKRLCKEDVHLPVKSDRSSCVVCFRVDSGGRRREVGVSKKCRTCEAPLCTRIRDGEPFRKTCFEIFHSSARLEPRQRQ